MTPTGTAVGNPVAGPESGSASTKTLAEQPPVPPDTKRAETKKASAPTKSPPQTKTQPRVDRPATSTSQRQTSAPASVRSAETGLATLRLLINPPATLFVDNVNKGQQTRFSEPLIPGTHTIRVEREGWLTKDTTVTISAGQPATIRINLTERP